MSVTVTKRHLWAFWALHFSAGVLSVVFAFTNVILVPISLAFSVVGMTPLVVLTYSKRNTVDWSFLKLLFIGIAAGVLYVTICWVLTLNDIYWGLFIAYFSWGIFFSTSIHFAVSIPDLIKRDRVEPSEDF